MRSCACMCVFLSQQSDRWNLSQGSSQKPSCLPRRHRCQNLFWRDETPKGDHVTPHSTHTCTLSNAHSVPVNLGVVDRQRCCMTGVKTNQSLDQHVDDSQWWTYLWYGRERVVEIMKDNSDMLVQLWVSVLHKTAAVTHTSSSTQWRTHKAVTLLSPQLRLRYRGLFKVHCKIREFF